MLVQKLNETIVTQLPHLNFPLVYTACNLKGNLLVGFEVVDQGLQFPVGPPLLGSALEYQTVLSCSLILLHFRHLKLVMICPVQKYVNIFLDLLQGVLPGLQPFHYLVV